MSELQASKRRTSDPVSEALSHSAEVIADVALQGDALASIPVVGTAVQLLKAVDTVRDRVMVAKMLRFVQGLEGLTNREIESMKAKLKEPEQLEKIGSQLLLTLDKLTEVDKAFLLGKIFRAFVHGRCDQEQLRRLVRAVDIAYLDDLVSFGRHLNTVLPRKSSLLMNLLDSGLAELHLDTGPVQVGADSLAVRTTELGRLMQILVASNPAAKLK